MVSHFIETLAFISWPIQILIGLSMFPLMLCHWLLCFSQMQPCWLIAKKQIVVSQSSAEFEYHAFAHVTNVWWFCYLLLELTFLYTHLHFYFVTIGLLSTWASILCFMLVFNISTLIYISFMSWLHVRLFGFDKFLQSLSLRIYLLMDCLVSGFSPDVSNCSSINSHYDCGQC